jgi:hypothetical protein
MMAGLSRSAAACSAATSSTARKATWENFHEDAYLAANPDVSRAIQGGFFRSGRQHFLIHGHGEGRYLRLSNEIEPLRAAKIDRIHSLLRLDLPHRRCGLKYDFLTDQLRTEAGISDTENVSGHSYYDELFSLIENSEMILDCGAGRRPVYYGNVVTRHWLEGLFAGEPQSLGQSEC